MPLLNNRGNGLRPDDGSDLRTAPLLLGALVVLKRRHDPGDDEFDGLVLPNPNHGPSSFDE